MLGDVLALGFVCGDLVLSPVDALPPTGGNRFVEQATLLVGGCAANAAVGFVRLDDTPRRVAVAGRVGNDPLGALLTRSLRQEGLDTTTLLNTAEAATSINTVLVTAQGERSFYVYPGACAHVTPADAPDSLLAQFNHLHLAAIGSLPALVSDAAADVARRARDLGLTVSLDITLNPPRDTAADILPILPYVDLFLPNLAEAQAVLGADDAATLLRRGLAYGPRLMGLKLGAAGCMLASGAEQIAAPAYPVQAVDTVGAGDAWAVAVVYGWYQGWPLETIARFANAAGALCTLQVGASAGMPTLAAIRQFIESDRLERTSQ